MGATRDPRIDYLRVAAIGFILLHHADDYAIVFLRATPLLARLDDTLAWVALAVLFVLSGFLTSRPGPGGTTSGWAYVRRRLARLYLPFAIALVLFRLLGTYRFDWDALLLNLALLGPWAGTAVATLWFVEVLLYYHALHAVWLSVAPLRQRPWTMPLLAGAVTAAAATLASSAGLALDPRIAAYAAAFTGGVCLGACSQFRQDRAGWSRALAASAGATGVTTLALAVLPIWKEPVAPQFVTAAATMLAVCAVIALPRSQSPRFGRGNALLQHIAYGSYMAYLAHRIVFRLVANALAPLGDLAVTVAVVASIPLVLGLGIWLQGRYEPWAQALTTERA